MNLFGTDGIRGVYGATLTKETAYALGAGLVKLGGEIIVTGCDTRVSGGELTAALTKGVNDYGGQTINLGVTPTNAVAYFTRISGAGYGVMISASHNPPEYNGLKVFDKYGIKICEKVQVELSEFIDGFNVVLPTEIPVAQVYDGGEDAYSKYVLKAVDANLDGLKVALDCCYGSAYKVAKRVFAECGAKVVAYCDFNRGDKINVGCGATKTDFLLSQMKDNGCDIGFAFDGDADRLAVVADGKAVEADRIFYAFCKYFKQSNRLLGLTAVGTIMTNGGLSNALKKSGIQLLRTDVGDSKIYEAMTKKGCNVGGENSGHYLLSDFATGSDAIINALLVSKIVVEKGDIFDYTAEYVPFESITENFVCTDAQKQEFLQNNTLGNIIAIFNKKYPLLRIVLRFSGTEPKIRCFIEGKTQSAVKNGFLFAKKQIQNALNDILSGNDT